jgi:DNA-binding cell septation regulator SpoVG
MVAVIGTHPSAGNRSTGNAIAQYAIDNASRLGVKYVIWEQRIWQPSSGQWVAMNDRGSVTENHYDHVHISSY